MKIVTIPPPFSLHSLMLASCFLFLSAPVFGQEVESPQVIVSVDARFQASRLPELDLELACKPGVAGKETFHFSKDRIFDWKTGMPLDGKTNCNLRALLPDGYSATYVINGEAQASPGGKGCWFRRIGVDDQTQCRVDISQDPVKLMVYLEWIGPSGEEKDVRVGLECESGDYSGYRYVNAGEPDGWEIRDIDPEGILCNVSEEVRDNFRPDIIDCQGLLVLPGKGEECTLINTKIVKRIEMLNRYGRIVMILLVLGVGLAAARRFA